MKAIQLFFRGRAYPSVTVDKHFGLIVIRPGGLASVFAGHGGVAPKAVGREWMATDARGFWRTFSEIDRTAPDDVEMFFNRYGDPDCLLDKEGYSTTTAWLDHQKPLGIAASAWEEPDADGVSYQTNNEQRLRESRRFLGEWPALRASLVQDGNTGGVVPKAETLMAYMSLSAAIMMAATSPMKRCAHCNHWFGFNDIRAQFCSVSCRNSAHRAKKKGVL